MESWYTMGDHIVASYVENVASRVVVFGLDGQVAGDITLPTQGSVGGLSADPFDSEAVFVFSSFFVPPTTYRYDVATGVLTEVARVETDVDVSRFELEQVTVASGDGTPINVYMVHPRGITRDGTQPVLLTGYGGFNIPLMPTFTRNIIHWLEQGGTYAVANIRGGGEFGEAWHQAGMLANKQNVFDDFEAVIRWFSDSGYSNPSRIAINGGSNGGLLMGAMITQCPEAFQAAVADVGLYDMVRFTQFPPAEIWMAEYGDPSEAAAFEYLLAYSPYHNVTDGTAYPSVLITTAEQDTRVSWRHSTKFAARLQDSTSSDRPVLFYMSRTTGHGAGTGQTDLVREFVRMYTFLETELGM
jgi:prolyl oligopeptidase